MASVDAEVTERLVAELQDKRDELAKLTRVEDAEELASKREEAICQLEARLRQHGIEAAVDAREDELAAERAKPKAELAVARADEAADRAARRAVLAAKLRAQRRR